MNRRAHHPSANMNLREYFAAHAPAEPQAWFEPKTEPMPEKNPLWRWCEHCKNDYGECLAPQQDNAYGDCASLRAYKEQADVWAEIQDRERLIQWPFAWADAVLSADMHKPS